MTAQATAPFTFTFEGETAVRVIERNGSPWFYAADVCRALGISNPRDAVGRLAPEGVASTDTLGGQQEALIVSESGLFTLILRSRDAIKPGTLPHRFRRWVTGEVLPAIRRTGQVTVVQPPEPGHPIPEAARLRMVREARQTFGVRAAGQLWFGLGLPVVPAMRTPAPQLDLFN